METKETKSGFSKFLKKHWIKILVITLFIILTAYVYTVFKNSALGKLTGDLFTTGDKLLKLINKTLDCFSSPNGSCVGLFIGFASLLMLFGLFKFRDSLTKKTEAQKTIDDNAKLENELNPEKSETKIKQELMDHCEKVQKTLEEKGYEQSKIDAYVKSSGLKQSQKRLEITVKSSASSQNKSTAEAAKAQIEFTNSLVEKQIEESKNDDVLNDEDVENMDKDVTEEHPDIEPIHAAI